MNTRYPSSIYDHCQTCGHFRTSHCDPITGKPSRCRRCQLRTDSTPEPGEKLINRLKRPEDRGIACHTFKEKPENPL